MLQAYVLSVSVCFSCMFQLFYADIAKIDRDVVYVAMVVHVGCKCLSKVDRDVLHVAMAFQMYISNVHPF
jgi:hypothetical protein